MSGRVQKTNSAGKLCFLTLRQRTVTVQSVIAQDATNVSKQMLKFANEYVFLFLPFIRLIKNYRITTESLVLIEAIVVKPKEIVKSCTVQTVELKIQKVSFVIFFSF